ncbi:hypothetical protein ES677_14040 [Bizionia gelidisalsuginis]|uniref:Uncharacterized protein n=2 Tax=Bizionia TaxID=283785 RepID=A0A8H2LC15_9FLAO|nr:MULTISPECIES: hypothetical protein [Bizionia]TYB72492.1 hypothetical protein ES676_11015 [Bizionia saleffrena]TYC08793.1 hypothetical protein ES677_14040 [Bizionia gelidisalsuginis]
MKINPLIYLFLLVFISCNNDKKESDKDIDTDSVKKELTSYNYVYEGDLERAYIKHRIIDLKKELESLNATIQAGKNDENSIVFLEETEAEILKLNNDYQAIILVKKGVLPIIPPPPPPPPVPCLCFDVFNRLNQVVATNTVVSLSATLTDNNGKKIFSTKDIMPEPILDTRLVVFDLNTDLEKFTDEGFLTIEKIMKDDSKKTYDVSVSVHPIENTP